MIRLISLVTGKSLSEALIFASTNPQYDDRLFIVYENCKLRIAAEHAVYTNCCFCFVLTFRTILLHNMFCRCCELLKKIYLYYKHATLAVLFLWSLVDSVFLKLFVEYLYTAQYSLKIALCVNKIYTLTINGHILA